MAFDIKVNPSSDDRFIEETGKNRYGGITIVLSKMKWVGSGILSAIVMAASAAIIIADGYLYNIPLFYMIGGLMVLAVVTIVYKLVWSLGRKSA